MRRAFTLGELLIVVGIIAIIAAFLLPLISVVRNGIPHHRYTVVKQSGYSYHTDDIVRLPDGVRFVDTDGSVVDVHGTYTVYDRQPQAESGR